MLMTSNIVEKCSRCRKSLVMPVTKEMATWIREKAISRHQHEKNQMLEFSDKSFKASITKMLHDQLKIILNKNIKPQQRIK